MIYEKRNTPVEDDSFTVGDSDVRLLCSGQSRSGVDGDALMSGERECLFTEIAQQRSEFSQLRSELGREITALRQEVALL